MSGDLSIVLKVKCNWVMQQDNDPKHKSESVI
uniref:Uncharacterized protein n=1 Tax=Anguilla anguilla TaxID=7936 RepID=A0A0E9RMC2_ANGAN